MEVYAREGLGDVQFTRLPVEPDTVPVKHAIGRVGILLDFENDQSAADSVDPAAGQKHGITGLDRQAMKTFRNLAGLNFFFEQFAGNARFWVRRPARRPCPQADGPGETISPAHRAVSSAAETALVAVWNRPAMRRHDAPSTIADPCRPEARWQ
jgi:hypothetical protein